MLLPVIRDEPNVECEEYEELLILLSHTVVHPGTVVVHLLYTPANTSALSPGN
jgi:hypothetical protein